jgi:cell division protein FtsI/penicillin-binding protein 2/beta-lactamase regulating signal transducer with metallopeptidase domain
MNTTPLLDLLSHTALKGAAVLLVALTLGLVLRRTAAARRYALWITAIATLAVLPLAMWALPAWRVLPRTDAALEWPVLEPPMVLENAAPLVPPPEITASLPTAESATPGPAEAPATPAFSWDAAWQDVVAALPGMWMLVAGLLLLRLGSSAWRLRHLEASLRRGQCALLIQTARELGLKRMPILFIGPSESVPMVWGVWKPRLLLPSGFETWSKEKQRGVLLHELTHLKRGDPLALWTAQWVKALHWFNPLVWLTLRQLRADQERACDDAVLRHGVRASDYAQSLLDLSRHNRLAPGLSLCALTITRCAPVEARVKAILDPQRRREGLTLRWLASLAGGALLITLPVAMLHAIEGPTLRGRILDRNGVVLAQSTKEKVRVYPLKTLASHVVGYTRLPDSDDARLHGGAGMEKKEDATLKAGKDLSLTLDARIQSLTLQAMRDGNVERGAAVVLDPRTGEILASVSLPSFDPNLFIPTISFNNWDRYLKDIDVPLLNRVVKGYVPGAASLPLTALAGIAAGVDDSKFTCEGRTIYGNNTMLCWIQRQNGGKHGVLDMRSAFLTSCNCFWHQFGNAAGIEHVEAMSQRIGFGTRYGILDEENAGIVPGPSWLEQNHPKERWSAGYTANTSIGQGFMLATPLQLAVLAATVGNNGKVPQPSLMRKASATAWRADLVYEGLDVPQLEILRDAMRLVVNGDNGTGKAARSDRVVIAGRTGNAQNWRIVDKKRVEDNNAWFIGFAPFDKPTLAFAILKNGGMSGGSDCAPIAKRIVEEALTLPADGSGEVLPVEDSLTPERLAHQQFDAKADALRAIVENIELEDATGFKVDEITVHKGQIMIHGTASGMTQALGFKNKLVSAKFDDPLEWSFPLPQTLKDGKGVKFRAQGVLIWKAEAATTPEEVKTPAKTPAAESVNFDFDAAEISREIKQLADKFGVIVRESKMGGGSLTLQGDGPSANSVLSYLEKLKELGAKHQIQWEIPPPLIQQDQTARFEVHGAYGTTPSNSAPATDAKAPTNQAEVRQQSDAAIRMKPALAKHWATLKRAGLLADLPAEAQPFDTIGIHEERRVKSMPEFHFYAWREAGHRWLLASLYSSKNVDEASLQWPEPPEAFQRTYAMAGHCMITIHSSDGKHLHIIVTQQKPSILIAPDESQEPQPAGKLAPEYHGKGLSQGEAMPTLNVALQTLRPTITPQDAQLPTFRPQPFQYKAQAPALPSAPTLEMPFPLNRLQGDLSAESEKALWRSLGNGTRMQQALVVRAPL